jgi:cytoskeletal protein CcmA (bactofilin family)
MFGKQSDTGVSRSQSLIQEGVSIRGEVRAEGDVRLEGNLEGSLVTDARIIVGATGRINADLEAEEVLVMGRVQGRVVGRKRIELRKGAHVEGDLVAQALVIEEGVFFQGLAQMTGPEAADGRAPKATAGRATRPSEAFQQLGGGQRAEAVDDVHSPTAPS